MHTFAVSFAAAVALANLQARDSQALTESWPNGKPRVVREVSSDGRGGWINDGAYASFFEDGSRESVGRYSKGQRVGVWESFHANGKPASKGRYLKSRMEGKWSFWREDGADNLADSGSYQPVLILDEHKRVTCEGQERDGQAHGSWTYYWSDGALQAEGSFRSGARHGEWVLFGLDGWPVRLFVSGEYGADQRLRELAPERWEQLEAQSRERNARLELDDASLPAWFRAAEVPAEIEATLRRFDSDHAQVAASLSKARLTLDLDQPADSETAKRWCALLMRSARTHHFGWPAEHWTGPPRSLRDVVRAWSALLALKANDWQFWQLSLQARCSAQRAPIGPHDGDCPQLVAPQLRADLGRARSALPSDRRWYELRFADPKGKAKLCGGPKEAAALEAALDWLVRHQDASGAWRPAGFIEQCARHAEHPACDGAGDDADRVGVTALAMLALLGDGSTLSRGSRRDAVRAATLWLLAERDSETGRFGDAKRTTFMYDHAFATHALSEALVSDEDPTLRGAVQAAVDYLARVQIRRDGERTAWSYNTPGMEEHVDSSLTSCVLLALVAARDAGVEIAPEVFAGGLKLLEKLTDPTTGRTGYDSPGSYSARVTGVNDHMALDRAEPLTALALAARLACGERGKTQPMLAKGVALLLQRPPQWNAAEHRIDFYYWCWGAQAMSWLGGEFETRPWIKPLREALLDGQAPVQGSLGSWSPRHDPWGYTGGRVYVTAMGALAFEGAFRIDPARFAAARK